MGRRVLAIVLGLVVVAVVIYLGYNSYGARRSGVSGDVFSNEKPPQTQKDDATTVDQSVRPSVVPPSQPEQATPVTPETSGETVQNGSPASDTISPNPPNGMVFSGTGKYQIYRQGNLTWRINTETGQSCVLFATDEEWKKPRVYRAGCGGR